MPFAEYFTFSRRKGRNRIVLCHAGNVLILIGMHFVKNWLFSNFPYENELITNYENGKTPMKDLP